MTIDENARARNDSSWLLGKTTEYLQESDVIISAILAGVAFEKLLNEIYLDKIGQLPNKPNAKMLLGILQDRPIWTDAQLKQFYAWVQLRDDAVHCKWNEIDPFALNQMIDGVRNYKEKYEAEKQREEVEVVIINQDQRLYDSLLSQELEFLAVAVILGSWSDSNERETTIVKDVCGVRWRDVANKLRKEAKVPLVYKADFWMVEDRLHLWKAIAPKITDRVLKGVVSHVAKILGEINSNLSNSADSTTISYSNTNFTYTREIREGVSEGLAIISNYTVNGMVCTPKLPQSLVSQVIAEILRDANWQMLASLNYLLPNLAEASPTVFLGYIKTAINGTYISGKDIYNTEGNIFGRNYFMGLLSALKRLAWHKPHFQDVILLLCKLSNLGLKDEVLSSLTTIYTDVFPQPTAPIRLMQATLVNLIKKHPDIGWSVLYKLIFERYSYYISIEKPKWMQIQSEYGDKNKLLQELPGLMDSYPALALEQAKTDLNKLCVLIESIEHLPLHAQADTIKYINNLSQNEFENEDKCKVWELLEGAVYRNKRYSAENWTLSTELLTLLKTATEKLNPQNILISVKLLFNQLGVDVLDDEGSYEEQAERILAKKTIELNKVYAQKGIEGIIYLTETVKDSADVGRALAESNDSSIDKALIPKYLKTDNKKINECVASYVSRRYYNGTTDRLKTFDFNILTSEQIGQFFAYLPLTKNIWELAEKTLDSNKSDYWQKVNPFSIELDSHSSYAIDKLLDHNRFDEALVSIYRLYYNKIYFDVKQCIKILQNVNSNYHRDSSSHNYHIVELIKLLQSKNPTDSPEIYDIEWRHIGLLQDNKRKEKPYFLERKLANDPEFFHNVICNTYNAKQTDSNNKKEFLQGNITASGCRSLLSYWRLPPGSKKQGDFDQISFKGWYKKVIELCTETDNLATAHEQIGRVLFYVPEAPEGLWIPPVVAEIVDQEGYPELGISYYREFQRDRGAYSIDPTGKKEQVIIDEYNRKALAVNEAGFPNFASNLRNIVSDVESDGLDIR